MNYLERRIFMRTCRRRQYYICGEWMHYELLPSSITFFQLKSRNECANPDVNQKKNFIESGTAKSNLFQT